MAIIWSSASFTTYLLRYQLKYLTGDIFTNLYVAQFGDMIATAVSGIMLLWFSQKQILILSYTLGTAGMLLLTLTKPEDQFLISLYIFIGKLGIAGARNTVYTACVTFFPVSIAATSIGICNIFCRSASVLSPFVAELKPDSVSQWVFIAFCGTAFIASFFLTTPQGDITQSFRSNRDT